MSIPLAILLRHEKNKSSVRSINFWFTCLCAYSPSLFIPPPAPAIIIKLSSVLCFDVFPSCEYHTFAFWQYFFFFLPKYKDRKGLTRQLAMLCRSRWCYHRYSPTSAVSDLFSSSCTHSKDHFAEKDTEARSPARARAIQSLTHQSCLPLASRNVCFTHVVPSSLYLSGGWGCI